MLLNKKLIEETINLRIMENDIPKEISVRNKASPIKSFSEFVPFTESELLTAYGKDIDGIKLKFRYVTLTINGRHSAK